MLSWPPPPERCVLWRLLIDERHQRRGIGRAVLAQISELLRADGATELCTSYVPADGNPAPFYERLGFLPTDEVEHGEIVLRLPLAAARTA